MARKTHLLCGTCCQPLSLGASRNVEDFCGVVYSERKVWRCDNTACDNTTSVIEIAEAAPARVRRPWWALIPVFGR